MKEILSSKEIPIPAGVTVEIKSRIVKVSGPLGKLERNFKNFKIDLKVIGKEKKKVREFVCWQHF